jgi:7,8-dihydropterin-6-yl-methyl-4-(beta-D-ribofuranosyl)aminobenzene 5'-phosphate synthase
MKATVLVDNIGSVELPDEWGLSIYIEYEDLKILLDAGASYIFQKNAETLGLSLAAVDFGVLSHAHYDHANGIMHFMEQNDKACFYLRAEAKDRYYDKPGFFYHYIGLPKELFKKYPERLKLIQAPKTELCPGVYLLAHSTDGLAAIGQSAKLYKKGPKGKEPDDFQHEQSLIFNTPRGLVVFNSCSHAGAQNILKEVTSAFPDQPIYALIGGFHLFGKPEAFVRELGQELNRLSVQKIYTGHCTGKAAFEILKSELGEKIAQMHTGLVMEF